MYNFNTKFMADGFQYEAVIGVSDHSWDRSMQRKVSWNWIKQSIQEAIENIIDDAYDGVESIIKNFKKNCTVFLKGVINENGSIKIIIKTVLDRANCFAKDGNVHEIH